MARAGIADPADVHFVQVKGPAFALADIVAAQRLGARPASDNPGKLTGFGRAASALGVGKVLGEISGERATEAAVLNDFGAYSSVASCSAGVEVKGNEVIVVGMSEKCSGPLGIAHGVLADALDVDGVRRALAGLGLPDRGQLSAEDARFAQRHRDLRLRRRRASGPRRRRPRRPHRRAPLIEKPMKKAPQ